MTTLTLALGVGLVAAAACAIWLYLRPRREAPSQALTEALGEAVRRLAPDDPSIDGPGAAGDAAATLRRVADRAGDRLDRLSSEREHLRTVLGSMSEGVLVADADGRTVLVNRSWRELFGVTGDVEGLSTLEVTRQRELERMLSETLDSGRGQQVELELVKDRRRTIILTSAPLTDGAGVVILSRDLTPFLRAGEIRRDFVANVSHELKTPLSAIRGFAETLDEGALEDRPAAGRFVERILVQCRRLEALLSDLLTLSRLEHPAARTGWGEIDMSAVVTEAVDLTREAGAERGIELEVDVQPVSTLPGDAEAMVRMCINLLENAIKYNRPQGRVEVRLAETGDRIVLEVSDTGIGISPGSVERLFERFYRVDKGRSRDEGGTGLGLAIVKHAAQLHGGSVEVESELGRGSCFRVSLPLDPSRQAPRHATLPEEPVAGL